MDTVTKERRSEIMRRVRSKNTGPERVLRSIVHHIGLRFRVKPYGLLGSPDLVLPRQRAVVFVHGCFWHGCVRCDRGRRMPKTNREFWMAKRIENRARDRRAISQLRVTGWRVIVVWECETKEGARLERRLRRALFSRPAKPSAV